MTRRSVLRAGAGMIGLAACSGAAQLLRPRPASAAIPYRYDYRTFGYGPFGSYNPKGTGRPGGLRCGIPPGSPPLKRSPGTSTLTISSGGFHDLVHFDRRVVIDTTEPVVFTRCLFTGPAVAPTDPSSVFDARGPNVNVQLYDCEITAQVVSPMLPGLAGHDMRVWRSYIHEVTDGFDLYGLDNGPANVDIRGCFVVALTYVTPDPQTRDNNTHNDGCEIFGGSNMSLVGNCMFDTVSTALGNPSGGPVPDPWLPSATAQCIAITNALGGVSNVLIDHNFLDYGQQSITMIAGSLGAPSNITITNNVFGRRQPMIQKANDPTFARRAILIDPRCPVNDFPAVTGPDTRCGNVYADDGSPVTIYRFVDGKAKAGP